MWKFFPTKLYTNYVRNEELSYEIIHELIKKALRDDQLNQVDEENSSLLIKILKTEGLDMKDKISGVIGKISSNILFYIALNHNWFLFSFRLHQRRHRAILAYSLVSSLLFNNLPRSSGKNLPRNCTYGRRTVA